MVTLVRSGFDCEFYNIEVGRLELNPTNPDLGVALTQARTAGFDVVFLRIPADDKRSIATLASQGLQPLETLVTSTLLRSVSRPMISEMVVVEDYARAALVDLGAISAITSEAIRHSHLFADPRLPVDQTRALFAAWARNDAAGRAQRIFIAREVGEVAGYLSVIIANGSVSIDLMTVRAASRGRGVGSALLTSFLTWHAKTTLVATVGTQANNPALALYRRFGFEPTHVDSTYHLWLDR